MNLEPTDEELEAAISARGLPNTFEEREDARDWFDAWAPIIARKVADWLDDHAAGRRIDYYCPSKSGRAATENAAMALRHGPGEWAYKDGERLWRTSDGKDVKP